MSETRPQHWIPYSGPAGWYTVWYPPSWKFDDESGTIRLMSPGGNGMLTLRSFWVPETVQIDLEDFIDLDELFPRRRKVRLLDPLDMDVISVVFEGEGATPRGGSWWQKIGRRTAWKKWRIWCLRKGTVCLVAMFLQTSNFDPEAETLAGMIVRSLEFAERPADPPERFAERVLELAQRKFPLLEAERVGDFQLRLGESTINLFNFYRTYAADPDQFESILLPALTTVVQVQGWGKEVLEPDLDQVRDRIMPMLYPEAVWQDRFPNFIGSSWVGGLVVLYVVDESQAYWYIRNELLDKWGISVDELHELAIENLDRYFQSSPMEFTLAGESEGPQLLLPVRPDAYNTSRFLSTDFQGRLRELLGHEFAVGVPSRDFFVAVSLNSPAAVEQVRQKVSEDFHHMDHPLSDRMLLVSNDGVSEFQAED